MVEKYIIKKTMFTYSSEGIKIISFESSQQLDLTSSATVVSKI